jgi:hypothetical protein
MGRLKRLFDTECMRLELCRVAGSAPVPSRATYHCDRETDARLCLDKHTSSTNATTDMRDQAARSESRILGLPFHAQVGRTHQAGETAPEFWRSAVKHPLPARRNKLCRISSTASFSSKCVQQDEHDLNAACSTTIQVLNLCDKKLWYLQ